MTEPANKASRRRRQTKGSDEDSDFDEADGDRPPDDVVSRFAADFDDDDDDDDDGDEPLKLSSPRVPLDRAAVGGQRRSKSQPKVTDRRREASLPESESDGHALGENGEPKKQKMEANQLAEPQSASRRSPDRVGGRSKSLTRSEARVSPKATEKRTRRDGSLPKLTEREERRAAQAGLSQAEGGNRKQSSGAGAGHKKPKMDAKKDAENVLVGGDKEKPTNSTAVRGQEYSNSIEALALEVKKRVVETEAKKVEADVTDLDLAADVALASFSRFLSDRLVELRGDLAKFYRIRGVLATRCFLYVIKLLLRHDTHGRALWYSKKDVRRQLISGFASYMASAGRLILSLGKYPPALHCAFWQASKFVSGKFEEAEMGWTEVSGSPPLRVPARFNNELYSSNFERVLENDELVAEKQGSKLEAALLALVTSDVDFVVGGAVQEFRQYKGDCRKMLAFLI